MKKLFNNGFLVQSHAVEWIHKETSYRGVASYKSWPLEEVDDYKAREITTKLNIWLNQWYEQNKTFSLWVCPDWDLICEYLEYCNDLKIQTRLLVVCSNMERQQISKSISSEIEQNLKFIGLDYVSASFDYSSILDDLFGDIPVNLKKYYEKLNEFGLFDTATDLANYIAERNIAITNGYDLENEIDLCEIGLFTYNL